jgi:hypothetical protein
MTQFVDDELPDESGKGMENNKPTLLTMLILLLLILSLLASLIWPIIRQTINNRLLRPTPTPLQIAMSNE